MLSPLIHHALLVPAPPRARPIVAITPSAWDEWSLQSVGIFDAAILAAGAAGVYFFSTRSSEEESTQSPDLKALEDLDDALGQAINGDIAGDPNELRAFAPLRRRSRPPDMAAESPTITRPFVYVPYGEAVPADLVAISCDGKCEGTEFDLTHWKDGFCTPDELYADTSTEIALNMARARVERGEYASHDDATIVNNHYDTDGVLSCWVAMEPHAALPHAELLAAAAAAGDFCEWSSDDGVKLDIAVCALCDDDAADEGFAEAFKKLPSLLANLDDHEELWRDEWEDVCAGYDKLKTVDAADGLGSGCSECEVVALAGGRLVVLTQPASAGRIAAPALHRKIREMGLANSYSAATEGEEAEPAQCLRVLRATREDNGEWSYEYEKIGHGWVRRLSVGTSRVSVPPVADVEGLIATLNEAGDGGEWVETSGLIEVCNTAKPIATPPWKVVAFLIGAEGVVLGA